jgi:hypothetical protein
MILNLGLETSKEAQETMVSKEIECGPLEHRVSRSYSIGTTYIS